MLTEFSGPVWRILFYAQAETPLAPARAPEGRFHHSGQCALYSSLSKKGAGIAIRRYVSKNDPPRVLRQFVVSGARVVDLRGHPGASIVWQDPRADGQLSPTWHMSDKARQNGADGILYSSRSRPDLSHLVLFKTDPELIQPNGAAVDWVPEW